MLVLLQKLQALEGLFPAGRKYSTSLFGAFCQSLLVPQIVSDPPVIILVPSHPGDPPTGVFAQMKLLQRILWPLRDPEVQEPGGDITSYGTDQSKDSLRDKHRRRDIEGQGQS